MRGFVEPSASASFFEPPDDDSMPCPYCSEEISCDAERCDCGWIKDYDGPEPDDWDDTPDDYIPPDYDPYGGP